MCSNPGSLPFDIYFSLETQMFFLPENLDISVEKGTFVFYELGAMTSSAWFQVNIRPWSLADCRRFAFLAFPRHFSSLRALEPRMNEIPSKWRLRPCLECFQTSFLSGIRALKFSVLAGASIVNLFSAVADLSKNLLAFPFFVVARPRKENDSVVALLIYHSRPFRISQMFTRLICQVECRGSCILTNGTKSLITIFACINPIAMIDRYQLLPILQIF